jgi:hypothetical protein
MEAEIDTRHQVSQLKSTIHHYPVRSLRSEIKLMELPPMKTEFHNAQVSEKGVVCGDASVK